MIFWGVYVFLCLFLCVFLFYFEIIIRCFVVSICDLVQYEKTVPDLC